MKAPCLTAYLAPAASYCPPLLSFISMAGEVKVRPYRKNITMRQAFRPLLYTMNKQIISDEVIAAFRTASCALKVT